MRWQLKTVISDHLGRGPVLVVYERQSDDLPQRAQRHYEVLTKIASTTKERKRKKTEEETAGETSEEGRNMAIMQKQITSEEGLNIATTQAEAVGELWNKAEKGFDALAPAASNATELLEVRDALELTDEFRAQVAGSSACP